MVVGVESACVQFGGGGGVHSLVMLEDVARRDLGLSQDPQRRVLSTMGTALISEQCMAAHYAEATFQQLHSHVS